MKVSEGGDTFLDVVHEINRHRHFDAGKATEASIARCLEENRFRNKGKPVPAKASSLRKIGIELPVGSLFKLADDETVYVVVP